MSLLESVVRQRVLTHLVAQGLSLKRPGSSTMRYTLVMDVIALHYLVSLVASKELTMQRGHNISLRGSKSRDIHESPK